MYSLRQCELFSKCIYNDYIKIPPKVQWRVKFDGNQMSLCTTIKYFKSTERLGLITLAC